MTLYIVAYDLVNDKDEQDYQELWDALDGLDSVKIQLSLWFVSSDLSATGLHDQLKAHMHSDDRLFISEIVSGGFAGSQAMQGSRAWLDAHLPRKRSGSIPA
ncbi:hypothetical protein WBP07_12545 [Novosphingobium sp. BL-8A]|uniref:hypothetical protein n=1 Tax=Novosphingobium sp. BL-8A TaxID=3127639 RepID=UPI0037580EE4